MSKEQLQLFRSLADQAEVYTELLNIAAELVTDDVLTKERAAKEILLVAEKLGDSLSMRIA